MQSAITIRDWTYAAFVALLLLSYGYSLLSQGFAARAEADSAVHVCAYVGESGVKTN
jgi:hypothetical protein